jgi:hypothetical protein
MSFRDGILALDPARSEGGQLSLNVAAMRWFQPALYLWAAPATLIGLAAIPVALVQGGRVSIVGGVVEAHGGVITRLLRIGLPGIGPGAAITFGHVVLACDDACLGIYRDHERVHVRQYERWGPFFIPLYLAAAAIAWWKGQDPYRDNPFEREAFALDDQRV